MQRLRLAAGFIGVAMIALAPSAMAGGVDGTGTVGTCPTTGKISIKPGLVTNGAVPDTLKIGAKNPKGVNCSGGTGDGGHVISGKSKGTGSNSTNDCATLSGPQSSNIVLTVKWKTDNGTKLNPSVISLTNQTGGLSANLHGQFDVTGTVTSGSFTGANVSAHVETDQDIVEIGNACAGKGLKKISFGSKPSKDDGKEGSGSVTIN